MNTREEKATLLRHALHVDTPGASSGFLGALRPYRGSLVSENYHEVMAALKVLAPDLSARMVERETIAAAWGICFLSRDWMHPEGMLGRNKLLSDPDTKILSEWIDDISYAVMVLLGGGSLEEAFHPYETRKDRA